MAPFGAAWDLPFRSGVIWENPSEVCPYLAARINFGSTLALKKFCAKIKIAPLWIFALMQLELHK
jgi:hypothetical protein